MLSFSQVLNLPSAKRQDVIRQAITILQRNKNDVNALMLGAAAFMGERDTNNARKMLENAHALKKKDPSILFWLTNFYKETNDHKKAVKAVAKLCALEPKNPQHLVKQGEVLENASEMKLAVLSYKKAQALGEKSSEIEAKIGDALRAMGDMEEATVSFNKALASDKNNARALYGLANSGKHSADSADDLVAKIDQALTVDQNPINASNLFYAAAKALADSDQIDRAFSYYKKANDIGLPSANERFSAELKDDPDAFRCEFINNLAAFSKEFIQRQSGLGLSSSQPIFILGMPRSGTTLVESICGAHASVAAADELPFLETLASQLGAQVATPEQYARNIAGMQKSDVQRFANSYLDHVKEMIGPSKHFTDKLPHNFMNVGLINLMFPNAKIIHCKRHPIDNCLSLYTNSMNPVHNFYKSDLKILGAYYREYLSLMEHWEAALSGKIHHIFYEDVVSNIELNSRQLIDYLDLAWEDRVMKREGSQKSVKTLSAWQVRQPVYTSSAGKWRKFEKHLGPLIDALGDCVPNYERELENLKTEVASN